MDVLEEDTFSSTEKTSLQHRGNCSCCYWKLLYASALAQKTFISGSVVENNKPLWYTHTYIYKLVMKYQRWSIKALSLNWWTEDDHFRTPTSLQNCLERWKLFGKAGEWTVFPIKYAFSKILIIKSCTLFSTFIILSTKKKVTTKQTLSSANVNFLPLKQLHCNDTKNLEIKTHIKIPINR